MSQLCPKGGSQLALLEPQGETYFGVSLDWEHDNPKRFAERLGAKPAIYVDFVSFPVPENQWQRLEGSFDRIHEQGAIPLLTLEPKGVLSAIDDKSAGKLADWLEKQNARGVPAFIRFAHEMNGSWYAWAQQPTSYIKAFRKLAAVIHKSAPLTAMIWAPNYGGGYPFADGPYSVLPDSPDFQILDTNKDGMLSSNDDPYGPFYPGDDAVDWVGMSVYHWGNAYPWGENETPEPGKFLSMITGTYKGAGGDESALPDFYLEYVEHHGKPLAITETAAFYRPGAGGDPESAIKQSWWRQALSDETHRRLPRLAMINWFEWKKHEAEVNATVDWRVSSNEHLLKDFRSDLPSFLRYASDPASRYCLSTR